MKDKNGSIDRIKSLAQELDLATNASKASANLLSQQGDLSLQTKVLVFIKRSSCIHSRDEDLSEERQNLRPDMAFERQEGSRRVIEVIEFSCQYGYVTREENTLKHVFEQKRRKYAQLMRELSEVTQKRVRADGNNCFVAGCCLFTITEATQCNSEVQ
jgi:hypothetical protein